MITFGVIGAGGFSPIHLDALADNPRAEVRWLVDPDLARARERAKKYNIPKVSSDYREVLADEAVDAVDVLTPNHLHCSISVEAMRAGKDVVCIKPMAPTPAECDLMVETAERTGRRLAVSFHQRYDPVHQKVQELLRSGEFEHPISIAMRFCTNDVEKVMTPGRWYGVTEQVGGGRLFSGGSHLIDLLVSWMDPIQSVTAVTRRLVARYRDPALEEKYAGSDDHAVCILESESGTCATFTGSWASPMRTNEKTIYGVDQALHVYAEGTANYLELVKSNGNRILLLKQENWWSHCFQLAIDDHVAWFLDEAEPRYSLKETRHAMEVLFACYESSRTGRRVSCGQ